jgi:hypothetical protein
MSLARYHYANSLGFAVVFFFSFSGWGETESTWYVGHRWPILPAPDDSWWLWSSWWNEDWQGKPTYSQKTCPSVTLSTTNPTWPDLGSNPGRRGGKPATKRLSHGTALPVLRQLLSLHLPGGSEENQESLSYCSWCPNLDSNRKLPGYVTSVTPWASLLSYRTLFQECWTLMEK